MLIDPPLESGRRLATLNTLRRGRFKRLYEIPVPVELSQIAKSLVGVKKEVLVPLVRILAVLDRTGLEAGDFPFGAGQFPTTAQRNERRDAVSLLQLGDYLHPWI